MPALQKRSVRLHSSAQCSFYRNLSSLVFPTNTQRHYCTNPQGFSFELWNTFTSSVTTFLQLPIQLHVAKCFYNICPSVTLNTQKMKPTIHVHGENQIVRCVPLLFRKCQMKLKSKFEIPSN